MKSSWRVVFTLIVLSHPWAGCGANKAEPKNLFLPDSPASYVAPHSLPLEKNVLDELPATWRSTPSGRLSVTDAIYRAGYKGVRWDWTASDQLEIDEGDALKRYLVKAYHRVSFGAGIGFDLWIYNPIARPDKKLTLQLAANGYKKEVFFGLNYTGWRACCIQFAEMPDGGNAKKGTLRILPPEGVDEGWFVFDRLEIGRLTAHTMADHQLPYSENHNHWVNQYWWEQTEKPQPPESVQSEETALFRVVESNLAHGIADWHLMDQLIAPAKRQQLEQVDSSSECVRQKESLRTAARKQFGLLKLNHHGADVRGLNISTPYRGSPNPYANEIPWKDVEQEIFPAVVLDYLYHQDQEGRERLLDLLDWCKAQGVVAGHSYGSLSHVGYRSRRLAVGLYLCRDLLKETGRLEEWTDTLKWLSGFAECYTKKERPGGVGDDGMVAMARLICVLMQPDSPEKVRDWNSFFQWFNDVVEISDGTQGVIKADYSFYHHAMMLCGYWATNVPSYCHVLFALQGTPMTGSPAWNNLRQNLLVFNRMYRTSTRPFHLRGRHFEDTSDYRMLDALRTMGLLGDSAAGSGVDAELAAVWMDGRPGSDGAPAAFASFAPQERYHQVLNWAGVSTHAIPGACATIRGVSTTLMNWDAGEGRSYARYNRCGSLYLNKHEAGNPTSTEACGYLDRGWDWSRVPGVTAVYLPNEELDKATEHSGGYGDERSFAGGVELDGNGLYGYRISEQQDKTWNGYKSYFFFEDRIVCLGSGLSSEHTKSPLETTLFQLHLPSEQDAIQVDERAVTTFPFSDRVKGGEVRLVDSQGHGYYLPAGYDTLELRKQQQIMGNALGETHTNAFALAWLDHGIQPKAAQYEYMIRLNAPVAATGYTVLRKDDTAHVVRDERSGMIGYVLFAPAEDLPGPISSCSRSGLIMVQPMEKQMQIRFCDPDLMINPGGERTRYNLQDVPPSPERKIVLVLKPEWHVNGEAESELHFTTANGITEAFTASRSTVSDTQN